jgi:hypothetical protein
VAAGIFGEAVEHDVGAVRSGCCQSGPRKVLSIAIGGFSSSKIASRAGGDRLDIDQLRWSGWPGFRDRSKRHAAGWMPCSSTASISSRVAPAGKSSQCTPKRPRMRAISVSVAA